MINKEKLKIKYNYWAKNLKKLNNQITKKLLKIYRYAKQEITFLSENPNVLVLKNYSNK